MAPRSIPESIENDWNALYRDYPEIYDRFASFPYHPAVLDVIDERFPLAGKQVLEVGSGTGKQTLPLARRAAWVTGVEPEAAMREVAVREATRQRIANVSFIAGYAERLQLYDDYILIQGNEKMPPIKIRPSAWTSMTSGGLLTVGAKLVSWLPSARRRLR